MQLGQTLCFVPFFFVNHFTDEKGSEPDNIRKPMNLLVLLPVCIASMLYFIEYWTSTNIIYFLGFALGFNFIFPWIHRSWFHGEWWFLSNADSGIDCVLRSSLHPNFKAKAKVVQLDWNCYYVCGYNHKINSIYHKQFFPSR